jgi:DNA topoisomerase-3
MRLFIAEKPSLGEAIAQCLPGQKQKHRGSKGPTHITAGDDDVVTWCFGHIYELFEPQEYNEALKEWKMADLPIVPKEWRLKPKSDAREQIKVIKDLIAKASEVVNAGDPDREGQLLVDEVLEELKCRKPIKRLWLNATDEKSVQKALADIRDNSEFRTLKDSAQARSWGDWLVGMNATRKMTLLARDAGVEGTFSVGRVQTPTLALVVARDLAIENFKPKDFYAVRAQIQADGKSFWARWVRGEAVTLDEAGRLLDKSVADAVAGKLAGKPAVVTRFEAKEKSEGQPLTFSLDKLQMECNRRFGLSAQETLEIAQELYEGKLTSYPRTDCGYLPESQHAEAAEVLSGLSGLYPEEVSKADRSIRSATWNDKKVTAHHGIIPTGMPADLSGKKRDVYDLIARRYLAQFYGSFKFQETVVELLNEGEKLVAKGRVTLALGWKALMKADSTEEEEGDGAEEKVSLPVLKQSQATQCDKAEVEAKKTTPPPKFTEASLLAAMLNVHQFESDQEVKKRLKESAGIGTPATRANIIETLKKRGFIEEKKKALVSTDKGRQLISVLPAHMKSPGLTALFEQLLESIAAGELTKEAFLEKQTAFVTKFIQSDLNGKLKPSGPVHSCPECKKGHLRKRPGSKGVFWGCSCYPECKAMFEDAKGRPNLTAKPKAVVSEVEKCKDCGKGLVRRMGKKGAFWGCSGFPDCKTIYQDAKGKPKYA